MEGTRENRIEFTMHGYGKQSAFASFLPGVGGMKGIPIWCYYVNRGQGVVSFGVEDKDHSIMEYYPAHQAYQNVKTTGFRTFLRVNNRYGEAFRDVEIPHGMRIHRNGLTIWEQNASLGIRTEVHYTNLPGEILGGLVRRVTFENLTDKDLELEILDGMPAIVPYGMDLHSLKEMGQTSKAWMQVENVDEQIPVFKVRASTKDGAVVTSVKGANFSLAIDEEGKKLSPIVDPDVVFAYDNSLQVAKKMEQEGLEGVLASHQVLSNQYPCSFFARKGRIPAGKRITLYELYGQVRNGKELRKFLEQPLTPEYFAEKEAESDRLTEELCKAIDTKTANPDFDEYCRYTYMDNALRGGYPILLSGNKVFYVYSRKHGDLERDYNFSRMLPEFYSQGNGNYRDVNQNRRMDNFFTPFVEKTNLKRFMGLIQLDGYNPLAVEQVTYSLNEDDVEEIFDLLSQGQKEELMEELTDSFTPGGFYKKLQTLGIWDRETQDQFFERTMERATENVNAEYAEGYWCDHWTYNLDLIESYLSIYPEKEEETLFEEDYTYYACQIPVLPRAKRYVRGEDGIRQYHFQDESMRRDDGEYLVRSRFGLGDPVKVTLLEKLLLLCTTKYADLDAYGMGIEMAGGKPGWYESLNGLPGLFGSSMNETYELARLLKYLISFLKKTATPVMLSAEVADYLRTMDSITLMHKNEIARNGELLEFWNSRNDAKESYNLHTFHGISGEKSEVSREEICLSLENMLETVLMGIQKAKAYCGEDVPAYFYYDCVDYEENADGIHPLHFERSKVTGFLEANVHYLRLIRDLDEKRKLYQGIKASDLYDRSLKMYKVNTSLEGQPYEIGRATAFTPGWLENESVWMHMEYKYLLELLKSGLYEEYLEDFVNAAIPFQDPKRYGRSIYENSSFIASSKNPNQAYRGKGFVARLSGSTVEFLQMWKIMMFGREPFRVVDGKLQLRLEPALPACLIPEEGVVESTFLGTINVRYHFGKSKDILPGRDCIKQMELYYRNGNRLEICGGIVEEAAAQAVREGEVERIEVFLE